MPYNDPPEDRSCTSSSRTNPADDIPRTGCYGRPDPQITLVRASPPNSSRSLAATGRSAWRLHYDTKGETSNDTGGDEQKKEQPTPLPLKWQLKPQDENMQTLYNFNETAIPPKSQFYSSDETSNEKLKLLYGDRKVSETCCQACVIL